MYSHSETEVYVQAKTGTSTSATSTTITKPTATTSVKQQIQQAFPDAPVMVNIASCESHLRQFDSSGKVLRGIINNKDEGVFQINDTYHLAASQKMGINIHTLAGNIKYARYLYDNEGTAPWNWSKVKWSKGECKS